MQRIALGSQSFVHNTTIPLVHTCEGADRSPEIHWSQIPKEAKSLVLIVDDPDAPDPAAPKLTWVHWVLYNIPVSIQNLPEGASANLPTGIMEGTNNWNKTGYGGPCPPIGEHRYFFKIYALDIVLPDLNQPLKDVLLKAMEGHVVGKGELMGKYKKRD